MCLRLLVYVMLALIWTGGVAPHPQARPPYGLSDLDPIMIKKRQEQYKKDPRTSCVPLVTFSACLSFELNRKSVTFALRDPEPGPEGSLRPSRSLRSTRYVQIWNRIPDFLASKIVTLSFNGPITIPHGPTAIHPEKQVTLVVTASVVPPNTISYPESPEVEILPVDDSESGGPSIETCARLYVAPIEPSEWDAGTAVWAHILHSLQAVAQDPPAAQANPMHFTLIIDIAWANPDFSRMLYYKERGDSIIGFVLLSIQQRHTVLPDGLWKDFRKVISDSIPKRRFGGGTPA